MFLTIPKNPTKQKHVAYIICSTILGLLLSLNAHALIEISYLSWAERHGVAVHFYGDCALHPALQYIIWALGAVGGFFLGRVWWRLVYVDRVWAKK